MSANLFSRDWYLIADLKPQLKSHVNVNAHRYRGKRWYVLEDRVTGQVRRLSPQSYLIVGLMNGERSIDQLWDISSQRLAEEMPTHEELLQLVSSLYQANLIRMDVSGDVVEIFERGKEATRKRWMAKLKSPLSIQIPLIDPEKFLVATEKYVKPIFSVYFLIIWCVLFITMLILAGQHWDELTSNVADRVLAADNLFLLWLIYPFIKLLHELGHAYCVKRNGGEVHEMGIMLLVFLPMPYVDASACSAFADKKQRVLVGSAGILTELFIASLAMLVWVNSEPGLAKSIAYNIMFIAGVSTVLVNGNPLLRFDGYYILADYLEIPNLAQRANQYWGWLSKRFLFGVKGIQPPSYDKKESFWLFSYGFGALIYRLFLMATIVLFVAQQYFLIGIILAVWALVGTLIWPNLKVLYKGWTDQENRTGSRSPVIMIPLTSVVVLLIVSALPLPLTTTIEGVVQFDKERRVLSNENCFISDVHKRSGETVLKGDLLISCTNKQLQTKQQVLRQQYIEASAQRQGVWNDPVNIKIYDDEISRLRNEIDDNQKRIDSLKIYALSDGVLVIRNPIDLTGKYIMRGELIGHVITNTSVQVRGMVPESDIEHVRERVTRVVARQSSNLGTLYQPVSWHLYPAGSKDVVSEILTESAGGDIIVNPAESKPRSFQIYFTVLLEFERLLHVHADERIFIQFIHPPEAIVFRAYRLVRRTFLKYFDV